MHMQRSQSESHTTPSLSVLMPVYNVQRYLAEAVESILNQTFTDFELICVDDGSTDDSLEILQGYAACDPRIRIISRPNTGIVGALNDALAAATAPLIARMDGDDTSSPTRFEKQIDYMNQNLNCIAVGTWCTRTDPFGNPAGEQHPPLTHDEIDTALMQADGSSVIHATMIIRREPLQQIGGWNPQYDWVEDFDLLLRLAEQGALANIPEPLYAYRRHTESICFTKYAQMCDRLRDVLTEAHKRRNLPLLSDMQSIRPELPKKQSAAEHYRSWACHAINHHNKKFAYRHALTALCHEPFNLKSWQVAYWALSA
ncbi:glycosyltransferase family 2 protein [Poriferisphaera sp. WC338]|uniref:glycosyltransferase family 2 protein n=1 Tax=Poriferisphaera sp. WC338 TaxID=3425129 RepID=UPI003D818BCD